MRKYSDAQPEYPTPDNIRGIAWEGGNGPDDDGPDLPIKTSQDQSNNPLRTSLDDIWLDDHQPSWGIIQ